jgi:hypothetical protein
MLFSIAMQMAGSLRIQVQKASGVCADEPADVGSREL